MTPLPGHLRIPAGRAPLSRSHDVALDCRRLSPPAVLSRSSRGPRAQRNGPPRRRRQPISSGACRPGDRRYRFIGRLILRRWRRSGSVRRHTRHHELLSASGVVPVHEDLGVNLPIWGECDGQMVAGGELRHPIQLADGSDARCVGVNDDELCSDGRALIADDDVASAEDRRDTSSLQPSSQGGPPRSTAIGVSESVPYELFRSLGRAGNRQMRPHRPLPKD